MARSSFFTIRTQAKQLEIGASFQLDHKYLNRLRLRLLWARHTRQLSTLDQVRWFARLLLWVQRKHPEVDFESKLRI